MKDDTMVRAFATDIVDYAFTEQQKSDIGVNELMRIEERIYGYVKCLYAEATEKIENDPK